MAISKTDFINYTRCPRYAALEEIKKELLDADITYEEYKEKEKEDFLSEMLGCMYEDDTYEVDLTKKVDEQLMALMPYYRQVEIESGRLVQKYFGGKSIFAESTFEQECFEFNKNGIKYLCYVDIYNEVDNNINIIEVKATTTKKYLDLACKNNNVEYSIFHYDKESNTYKLKDEIANYPLESEMSKEKYLRQKNKLFDRYAKVGTYAYDLAIQRFIIEGDINNKNITDNIKYYLAVLNSNYVFDGTMKDNKPVYDKDKNGNELISFIDLTNVTKEYFSIIEQDSKILEKYLFELDSSSCPLGKWCERKKNKECKYFSLVCGSNIPKKNSSLNYMDNAQGFVDESGDRVKGLDIINRGYLGMLDVPESWIKSEKHHIQRDALRFNKDYIDKEKIKKGLSILKYPIYHLDFETLPCPLPRFRGEKPYTQSPFEFSLHIESSPGVCDKDKDNIVFLAKSFDNDERKELVESLLEHIDPDKGTLFAQNVSFEKSRIKELAGVFPEYKDKLMRIYDRGFDLMWLIKTKKDIYEDLGFDAKRSELPNYYSAKLSGSYSIKKTLPAFSDLSYDNLDVKNGTEAIVAYANYNKMTKEEFDLKYQALIDYCKQDTWAMVVILDALRNICK